MYDNGKILLTGGCPEHNCIHVSAVATAEVIDLQTSTPFWRSVAAMDFPRHSHHATLLPDGNVLITGGTTQPEIFNDEDDGILEVELWDSMNETFVTVAPMDEPRHFQSVSVLLPDGRVLVAGGVFGPSDSKARFSMTGQIYSPSYLFRGARPTIASAPVAVDYGQKFQLESPDALDIERVVLMGLSASSQGWNGSQSLTRLDFDSSFTYLTFVMPNNSNLVPPGFYLLFILNDHDVPSLGHIFRVGQN